MEKTLEITLVKSSIGSTPRQRKTIQALGLKKIKQTVIKNDSQTIRGMIKIVSHLVNVVEK